ncbi:MAG: ABC transporter substrate-binding protein [Trueperaceae bacterium]
MSTRPSAHPRGLLVSLLVSLLVAFAAASPQVRVAADLDGVLVALAEAYPGARPQAVEAGAQLLLQRGGVALRDLDSVVVVPGVTLSLLADDAEARAFQRFATSPAGQRALIAAGLLPDRVTVVDQGGRELTVAQPVERLASPYSLATYLAYGVGAGDRVVAAGFLGARDPDGIAAMTRIDPRFPDLVAFASQETTNVEAIASLAPDVVFASARSEWIESVEAIGVPVVVFDGESREQLIGAMRLAGALFGPDAAARAEAWATYYEEVVAQVVAFTSVLDELPKVLFTGTERTRVASGEMYQSFLVSAAGGASVTAGLGGFWNDVGVEQVIVWSPEVVLVPPYGRASVEAVLEDATWRTVPAVRDGTVYRVPKLVAPWDTPVPDSVLALVWLTEVLHPGLVGLSCVDETAFFYRRFYQYDISLEEATGLCSR